MRKSLTLSIAAATALAAGTAAFAQDGQKHDMTRAQVEERTAERFGKMDANSDGVLNDADREAARRQAFDSIDADHDGAISFAEFDARRGERREARDERRGPDGGGEPRFGHHRGSWGGRDMASEADADKDGTVTQAEFTTAALTRFDQADANSDGTISADERRAARGQMRHHWRHGARDDS